VYQAASKLTGSPSANDQTGKTETNGNHRHSSSCNFYAQKKTQPKYTLEFASW